jgi:hypothetical protein
MLHSAGGFMTTTSCPTRKPQQQCWRKYLAEELRGLCAGRRKAGGRDRDDFGEPTSYPRSRIAQQ